MSADNGRPGLDDLSARIREAQGRNEPIKVTEEVSKPLRASRLGVDFVAAILGCMGIGWLIGHFFPSLHPWALVAMVPVGFAVGALNLWREVAGVSGMSGTTLGKAGALRTRKALGDRSAQDKS